MVTFEVWIRSHGDSQVLSDTRGHSTLLDIQALPQSDAMRHCLDHHEALHFLPTIR